MQGKFILIFTSLCSTNISLYSSLFWRTIIACPNIYPNWSRKVKIRLSRPIFNCSFCWVITETEAGMKILFQRWRILPMAFVYWLYLLYANKVHQLVNFKVPDPRENGNKQAQELHHLPMYYLDKTKSKNLREEDQMLLKDCFMPIATQNPSNVS